MKKYIHSYDIALFCGIGMTLSLAPFYFFPFLILSVGILYSLCITKCIRSLKCAFLVGWWFGFAYFLTRLYWFIFPLLVDAKQTAWLIPFALFGLPGVLALYFGFGFAVFYQFHRYAKLYPPMIFASIISCTEWMIGHTAFNGFPWNLIGSAWIFSNEIMQLTSVIGVYGLSFVTILFISIIFDTLIKNANYLMCFVSILSLVSVYLWGLYRLDKNPTEYVENITLRLVNGNILREMQITQERANEVLEKYITLSTERNMRDISYVIWPEGAIDFRVDNYLINAIKLKLDANIILGAHRVNENDLFNSLYVNDANLYYDKRHLVPFGEYIPLRKILPISTIVPMLKEMSSNKNTNRNITVSSLPTFIPSICYEAIFPNAIINRKETPKAKWILNITDDAWFGRSLEQYQHADLAKVRAVEEGIPMVRVANAGINTVIDGYGRVVSLMPFGEAAILDVKLPTDIKNVTIYSEIANYIDWLIAFITILLLLSVVYYTVRSNTYIL